MTLVSHCRVNIRMSANPNVKSEDGSKNEGKIARKEKIQRCQLKNGQAE